MLDSFCLLLISKLRFFDFNMHSFGIHSIKPEVQLHFLRHIALSFLGLLLLLYHLSVHRSETLSRLLLRGYKSEYALFDLYGYVR